MSESARQQRFERTETLLSETLHSCDRLLNALLDERAAVQDNDLAALNGAVSRKKIHLADLERHEQKRVALLSACKHKSDLDSMQRFVADNDNRNAVLQDLWSSTLKRLAECREANNANGAIIAAQRRLHGDALAVLRNQDEPPETYGPGGKTETTGQYRALAEV
ncbi:MAG: flagella synthesis protein FlgN [Woeseiaceae bacterium]